MQGNTLPTIDQNLTCAPALSTDGVGVLIPSPSITYDVKLRSTFTGERHPRNPHPPHPLPVLGAAALLRRRRAYCLHRQEARRYRLGGYSFVSPPEFPNYCDSEPVFTLDGSLLSPSAGLRNVVYPVSVAHRFPPAPSLAYLPPAFRRVLFSPGADDSRHIASSGFAPLLTSPTLPSLAADAGEGFPPPAVFKSLVSAECALSSTHIQYTLPSDLDHETSPEISRNGSAVVVPDWLSVKYESKLDPLKFLDFPGCAFSRDEFTVASKPGGNRQYQHSGYVWYRGQKFARFVYDGRQEFTQDTLLLTLENWVFYDAGVRAVGYAALLDRLGVVLDSSSPTISRLDLAIDGLQVGEHLQRYYRGEIHKRGQAKISDFVSFDRKNQVFDSLRVGNRKSGRFFRIYNKTKELATNEKPYITSYLDVNRVPLDGLARGVLRGEFEFSRSWLSGLAGDYLSPTLLDDPKRLVRLVRHAAVAGDFLAFRVDDGTVNTSRHDVLGLLDDIDLTGVATIGKAEKPITDGLKTAKMAIKRSLFEGAATKCDSLAQDLFDGAVALARSRSLGDWLTENYPRWHEDIIEHAFNMGSPIDRVTLIIPRWLYDIGELFPRYDPVASTHAPAPVTVPVRQLDFLDICPPRRVLL